MTSPSHSTKNSVLASVDPARHVLIAGPTASGKSSLAMRLARAQGGLIVNADASQVYNCWRVLTARPSAEDEKSVHHELYGHVAATAPYSAGHWLRDIEKLLATGERLIIVGGTGLYFSALTQGLAMIPQTPADVRAQGDALDRDTMLAALDAETRSRIDCLNPVRVQRAWEVLQSTGRGLAQWQDQTGEPLLPLVGVQNIVVSAPKEWLNDRIVRRFDLMIAEGALEEVETMLPLYDPNLPAHRAIGAKELIAHLRGALTLEQAREDAIIATRQFAKRQRTWFRSKMGNWNIFDPATEIHLPKTD